MDQETTTTIRDVAARAGCSIATVSRVVTGNGPVSDAMRKRVVAAALAVGFNINSPSQASRPVVCVLVPSITNPVFAAVLAGVEQTVRNHGLSVVVGQSNYDPAQEEKIAATLIAERPVGLVVTVCDPDRSLLLEAAARQKLPTVTVYNEHHPPGIGAVSVDNRQASLRMTNKLLELGHRRILFVGGRFASSDRAACRYQGYQDAVQAARLMPLPPFEVDFIDATRDIDLTHAIHEHRPTAIMASNDLLAITVISSLRRMGLSVPADISVTGFDGIDVVRHMSPKLTTIAQPSLTMGVLAASMVLDMAAGRRRPEHLRADINILAGETIAPSRENDEAMLSSNQPLRKTRS